MRRPDKYFWRGPAGDAWSRREPRKHQQTDFEFDDVQLKRFAEAIAAAAPAVKQVNIEIEVERRKAS
jgi:hypothetical protein